MQGYRGLKVYQLAYRLVMEIFHLEEKYSLTDQIRRSSRSVLANIAEGFRIAALCFLSTAFCLLFK